MDHLTRRRLTERMTTGWATATLVAATITNGLMAGLFAAYSYAVMPGLGRASDRTFVAFAIPMTRMTVVSYRNELPTALPPGQNFVAIVSLMIATRGDITLSVDEKLRPATSRMPTASKKPESAAV